MPKLFRHDLHLIVIIWDKSTKYFELPENSRLIEFTFLPCIRPSSASGYLEHPTDLEYKEDTDTPIGPSNTLSMLNI